MFRKLIPIIIFFLLLPSLSKAYTLILNDGTTLEDKTLAESKDYTKVDYGPVSFNFGSKPVDMIELESPVIEEKKFSFSFVKEAQALDVPVSAIMNAYFRTSDAIDQAQDIKDLQGFISQQYFNMLNEKVSHGAYEVIVLELLRNLKPKNIKVMDARVFDNQAEVSVIGNTLMGEVHGIATMVQEEGAWKLEKETWFGGDKLAVNKAWPVVSAGSAVRDIKNKPKFRYNLSDYYFNQNYLSLTKPVMPKRKNAFILYFYVSMDKKQKLIDQYGDEIKTKKPSLHVVWTGPRQFVPKQIVYKDVYNHMDVSLASEKDGYLPGAFNLQLPRKKPKEFLGGFLMNF